MERAGEGKGLGDNRSFALYGSKPTAQFRTTLIGAGPVAVSTLLSMRNRPSAATSYRVAESLGGAGMCS